VIAKYLPLLAASLRRKRLRTFFTVASIVIAFLLFGLAESLRYALQSGVDVAGADRLLTMHKVSFTQLLPASYENRIKALDGVVEVTPQTWFGAWFRDERNQIPAFPVKPEAFLRMYPEYVIPEAQRLEWLADRSGILIGRGLADLFGGAGTRFRCARPSGARKTAATHGTSRPAIYDLPQVATRQLMMHQTTEEAGAGQGPSGTSSRWTRDRAQPVARQIDLQSGLELPAETKTSSERAMAQSFVNQIGNIGAMRDRDRFFTMLLVTANTMAQSVRERTNELAVLKTLGFTNAGSGWCCRSAARDGAGRRAWAHCGVVAGVQFEPVFRQYLPGFQLPQQAIVSGGLYMLALGLAAGAVPAAQAMRLRIVEALRRD
jgi:putative ABC transport system permease protein